MSRYSKLREDPKTKRAGLPWLNEEDEDLIRRAKTTMEIEEIAAVHERTVRAVDLRIMDHALKLAAIEDKTINEVSEIFHLDSEDLTTYQNRKNMKIARKSVKKIHPRPKIEDLLLQIIELLKEVSRILEEVKIIAGDDDEENHPSIRILREKKKIVPIDLVFCE